MLMMKISNLNLDKKYKFFPYLPNNKFRTLKEDVHEWGVLMPLMIDENYRPLDGWNRIRACQELGIEEIPVVICDTGMTEEEKVKIAIALVMDRHHITDTHREVAIRKAIKMFPGYSYSRLAEITGVSDKTIGKIINRNRPILGILEIGRSTGLDGKTRPNSKLAGEAQRQRIREAIGMDPNKSDRQIAREIGTSPTTVGTQRKAMEKEKTEVTKIDELAWDDKSKKFSLKPVYPERGA